MVTVHQYCIPWKWSHVYSHLIPREHGQGHPTAGPSYDRTTGIAIAHRCIHPLTLARVHCMYSVPRSKAPTNLSIQDE
jgi:hypothetical protein